MYMSILPFLHMHHIGQYDFVVKSYLNFRFFSGKVAKFTFHLRADSAFCDRQKSVHLPLEAVCDWLFEIQWGHD